jgi:glutamate/tyrosine decarboxylase-like PLP-dependent enzyme
MQSFAAIRILIAVDPVGPLARVGHTAATGPVWAHVDAAYAGA